MIFHIDLDAFFASVEQRDNPRLHGKPVIIGGPHAQLSGKEMSKGIVSTASYEARHYGIHSGMPLFQARKLCPHGKILPGNFHKYHKASQVFYEIVSSFTDCVENVTLDESYLSFTGFESYYPNLYNVAQLIRKRVEDEIGITCTIGISQYKEIAKIASNAAKPNGLLIIKPGREKTFLAPLPVRSIPGVGPAVEGKLKEYNIKTIGQLTKISDTTPKRLFGKHGSYVSRIAHGYGTQKLTTSGQQKSVGRETTFAHNTKDCRFLHTILLYLSCKVAFDLRKKKCKGKNITLKIRSAAFQTKTHQTMLVQATSDAMVIFEAAKKLLQHVWDFSQLRLIGISVSQLNPPLEQLLLFRNQKRNRRREKLTRSVDKLRSRFGFFATYPLTIQPLTKHKHNL